MKRIESLKHYNVFDGQKWHRVSAKNPLKALEKLEITSIRGVKINQLADFNQHIYG